MPSVFIPCIPSSTRTVPDAPTITSRTDVGTNRDYNNGAVTLAYSPPSWDGKLPITQYTATGSPGGSATDTDGSPVLVENLSTATSGVSHNFTMRAVNSIGASAASNTTASVLVTSVPGTPGTPTATTPAYNVVSLSFTNANSGGKAVSGYTVTSSPSIALTVTGTSSPLQVTGSFSAGTAYTFTVAATNANGTGQDSAASNSITPNNVSGGTRTFTQGAYRYHVFTTPGTLTVTGTSRTLVEALIVGGGGGGSRATGSGGGGGGGGASDSITVSPATLTTGNYTVAVGTGGLGGSGVNGNTGNTSSFNGTSRTGGGYGGNYFTTGGNGSCGGGAGATSGGAINGGTGSQGGNGGSGSTGGAGSGGGAGIVAGTVGSTGSTYSTWYSDSGVTVGTIGVGGGITNGTDGTPNTGNGGNGWNASSGTGGDGGSGMVIVRYPA